MASTDKSLHTKDFVKAAQADGFRYAVRLSDKADLPRVVKEWLEFDGPAFLEVMIDPDAGVYPMVPPGQGYDAMITGGHIRARTAAPVVEKPGASEMF
jgi:acetolactate synthase-1/2/3 large subunit